MNKKTEIAEITIPYNEALAFDKAMLAIKRLDFKIKNSDEKSGEINAETKISAHSWGERINILIKNTCEDSTKITITSSLKFGQNRITIARNKDNISKIINELTQKETSNTTGIQKSNIKNETTTEEKPNEKINPSIYWLIFIGLSLISNFTPPPVTIIVNLLFSLLSLSYIIYYILSNGISDIATGIIISSILVTTSLVFPPFLIVLAIWTIYNINNTIKAIKMLIPMLLYNASMLVCLLTASAAHFEGIKHQSTTAIIIQISANIIYFMIAFNFIKKLSYMSIKDGLMKVSILFASIQIVMIMIYSLNKAIESFFKVTTGISTRNIKIPQNVSAYMRGDIAVSSYTRNVSATVTETVTKHTAGIGAIIAGASGDASKKLNEK